MPVAVITGASAGLGAELAVKLAGEGWRLILINRNAERSQPILSRIAAQAPHAELALVEADLADMDQVRRAAAEMMQQTPRIDVLFNNAGVMLGERSFSRHGQEMQFQVNTLAPYLLMRLLMPSMAGGGIIVNVSSVAALMTGALKVDQLSRPRVFLKLFGAYGQSKLALSALTHALAPEFAAQGIQLRSVNPGGNRTKMTAGSGMPWPLRLVRPLLFLFRSPTYGVKLIYDAAFARRFQGKNGVFLSGNRVTRLPASATDPKVQAALLALCRQVTGL